MNTNTRWSASHDACVRVFPIDPWSVEREREELWTELQTLGFRAFTKTPTAQWLFEPCVQADDESVRKRAYLDALKAGNIIVGLKDKAGVLRFTETRSWEEGDFCVLDRKVARQYGWPCVTSGALKKELLRKEAFLQALVDNTLWMWYFEAQEESVVSGSAFLTEEEATEDALAVYPDCRYSDRDFDVNYHLKARN